MTDDKSIKFEPYYSNWTPETLRPHFESTKAFKDFLENPAAPDDWIARNWLQRAIIAELFGEPLPRPANMASGWGFLRIADVALCDILDAHGLLPPPPPPPTRWDRIRRWLDNKLGWRIRRQCWRLGDWLDELAERLEKRSD